VPKWQDLWAYAASYPNPAIYPAKMAGKRAYVRLSTPMTEAEIDTLVAAFKSGFAKVASMG
jgi:hypothetical protein